jgi:hypothetical protein
MVHGAHLESGYEGQDRVGWFRHVLTDWLSKLFQVSCWLLVEVRSGVRCRWFLCLCRGCVVSQYQNDEHRSGDDVAVCGLLSALYI